MSDSKAASAQDYESTLSESPATVAEFADREFTPIDRIQHLLHSSPALVPLIVLVASVVVFGLLLGTKFFSPFSLTLILQQVAIVGIVGAGQSLVVISKGIDLSVGAIMRLPPFIVTLGMWQIVLATNFLYSANETIRSQDIEAEAPLLQFFGGSFKAGGAVFTYGVIALILLVLFLHYALNHTAWGRHVYAVGDDAEAAELSGVQVKRTLISVYVVSGLICALAGWVLIGRLGSVSPTSGQFTNIESITAVVIGGISLFGGRGSVLGMLFGALIVGVFSLGLRLLGTDPQWTYLMIGLLIISAVAVDQWIRRVAG